MFSITRNFEITAKKQNKIDFPQCTDKAETNRIAYHLVREKSQFGNNKIYK